MKKKVLIQIKGVQHYDDENDVVELLTVGQLQRRGGAYFISYDESEATGFEGSRTTLKIEGSERITMQRSGSNRSQLIIEKGSRHQCLYEMEYGSMVMGVTGDVIESTLTDEGGLLHFQYTLDYNASMASTNEVYIKVNDNQHSAESAE